MANEKRLIDAIEYCWELVAERDYPGRTQEFMDAIEIAIADLGDMPTVDAVEVVHGQWLYDSGREHYFCSACNEDAFHTSIDNPVYDYDWEENLRYSHTETIYEEHLTDYCPNCGAKMDGERREGE